MQGTGFNVEDIARKTGCTVYDSQGDKIGTFDRVYYDFETSEPEWIGISSGFLGMKEVVAPLRGAAEFKDGLRVNFTKEQIKDSPDISGDEIEQDEERELYSYYGMDFSEERSSSQLPEGGTQQGTSRQTTTGGDTEESLTLHDEELRVGKRQVETGRVRLRKWVETQPVSEDVDLQQERIEIERQPVDRPAAGGQMGDQEIEVTLHGEEPVVEKQVTAREQVGVRKQTDTRTETVGGEVRREQVDVEGAEDFTDTGEEFTDADEHTHQGRH